MQILLHILRPYIESRRIYSANLFIKSYSAAEFLSSPLHNIMKHQVYRTTKYNKNQKVVIIFKFAAKRILNPCRIDPSNKI